MDQAERTLTDAEALQEQFQIDGPVQYVLEKFHDRGMANIPNI